MTHKILIELDEKTEAYLRGLAKKMGKTIQQAAGEIVKTFFEAYENARKKQ